MPDPESATDRTMASPSTAADRSIVPPAGSVTQGVRDEILHDLLETIRIGGHLVGPTGHGRANRDLLRHRLVLVPLHDVVEDTSDRKHPDLELSHPVFQSCQVHQILDDAVEPEGFAFECGEISLARDGIERQLRHAQGLDVAAHRGERSFQLVGNIRQHLAAETV